ncbi:MAG: ABC-type molybdate transport system, periplasmic component [Actinobacteria bacterium]|nr:ABC-type molybdate transport system, periplasmic component [Actinomycetota bacterium]
MTPRPLPAALARVAGRRGARRAAAWLTLLVCLAVPACSSGGESVLKVQFAGSLIIPFGALEEAYEAANPGVDVQMEGHGSIQVIRHVTEIGDLVDVVATADGALIPLLMYEERVPGTGRPYAEWYIEFAANRFALAYTPSSRGAGEITADNWHEVLGREGVTLGLADPRLDAAGYRALMVLALAEEEYGKPTLFFDLVGSRLRPIVTTAPEEEGTVIVVPELLEPVSGSGLLMRGASIQLVALLESGDLDYAFEESVIRQHGLQMVALPDSLNLAAEALRDQYRRVQVRLDFRRFASVQPVFDGDLIRYAVTIPTNAPNPEEAERFVAFLLGPEGRAIMAANYQEMLTPPEADHHDALPDALAPLTVPSP